MRVLIAEPADRPPVPHIDGANRGRRPSPAIRLDEGCCGRSDWLAPMSTILRTFVLATIAVPIVIYGLMPHLHRARGRLLARRR